MWPKYMLLAKEFMFARLAVEDLICGNCWNGIWVGMDHPVHSQERPQKSDVLMRDAYATNVDSHSVTEAPLGCTRNQCTFVINSATSVKFAALGITLTIPGTATWSNTLTSASINVISVTKPLRKQLPFETIKVCTSSFFSESVFDIFSSDQLAMCLHLKLQILSEHSMIVLVCFLFSNWSWLNLSIVTSFYMVHFIHIVILVSPETMTGGSHHFAIWNNIGNQRRF